MAKIEWAPIWISPRRRIQTFTVGVYMFLVLVVVLFSYVAWAVIFLTGNIYIKTITFIYAVWIYFDRHDAQNGVRGSGVRWMRDNWFWKYFRDYFPVELIKTAELPPNKNYLLACYPHGVIGVGVFTNMAADIFKWNQLFPKVRPHLATLSLHFHAPVWRHVVKSWGLISANRMSLTNNLTTSNDPKDALNADGYTSSAVAVVVGGAQEALDSRPGHYILTIKNRKGFIKLAMKTGAAIVPVFSFGEVDVFNQVDNPPDSLVRKTQVLVKKLTGVSFLLIIGRGFFQYSYGVLPHRRRIVQVVGAPIDVTQSDNPKEDEVDKLHQKFIEELNKLFETYKSKYLKDAKNISLVMK